MSLWSEINGMKGYLFYDWTFHVLHFVEEESLCSMEISVLRQGLGTRAENSVSQVGIDSKGSGVVSGFG